MEKHLNTLTIQMYVPLEDFVSSSPLSPKIHTPEFFENLLTSIESEHRTRATQHSFPNDFDRWRALPPLVERFEREQLRVRQHILNAGIDPTSLLLTARVSNWLRAWRHVLRNTFMLSYGVEETTEPGARWRTFSSRAPLT